MPYQSEAQRRYMHARHPEIAERWDERYGGGGDLPYHKNKDNPDPNNPFYTDQSRGSIIADYEQPDGMPGFDGVPDATTAGLGSGDEFAEPSGRVVTRFKQLGGPT